jgi:FkbM family methyltransferase
MTDMTAMPGAGEAKTIFDIGLHEGCDAEFYLKKGFRVVALEANPQLAAVAISRLRNDVETGRLVVVNKALASQSGGSIPFYIRTDKDGWSSIYRNSAERDGQASTRVDIEAVTMGDLVARYGVPYFLKCDIEGAEPIVLTQIAEAPERPRFVSVECFGEHGGEAVDLLVKAGYAHFQIVNQSYLALNKPPYPPREGAYVPMTFHGKMSGLFGEELEPAFWVGQDEVRRQLAGWHKLKAEEIDPVRRFLFRRYGKLTGRGWLIGRGWVDVHARLA